MTGTQLAKDIAIVLTVSILTLTIGYIITDTAMRNAPQENTQRVHRGVYTVCKMSNESMSRDLEVACGKLQDTTNTEFMCNQTKYNSSLVCWVEDK